MSTRAATARERAGNRRVRVDAWMRARRLSFRWLVAALPCLSACSRSYDGPYPHVVLISLDTTRADHLGCYGSPLVKTPAIDRLAHESVLFRHAMSAAPTTLASHTSIMTGLYPHTHGVPRNGFTLSAENETLAMVLARSGFHTAASRAAGLAGRIMRGVHSRRAERRLPIANGSGERSRGARTHGARTKFA